MEQKKNESKSTPANDKMSNVKSRVLSGKHPKAKSFFIDRVPMDVIEVFKKYANDEFVGDYGMTLKSILKDAMEFNAIKRRLLSDGNLSISVRLKDEKN